MEGRARVNFGGFECLVEELGFGFSGSGVIEGFIVYFISGLGFVVVVGFVLGVRFCNGFVGFGRFFLVLWVSFGVR